MCTVKSCNKKIHKNDKSLLKGQCISIKNKISPLNQSILFSLQEKIENGYGKNPSKLYINFAFQINYCGQ